MARRYSGSLTIYVQFTDGLDEVGRGEYAVSVTGPDGLMWPFDQVWVRPPPGVAYDAPQAHDEAARTAMTFGSYFESGNRRGVPEWAPDVETAVAIGDGLERDLDSCIVVRRVR